LTWSSRRRERQSYYIGVSKVNSQFDYDYQPGIQDPLSTIESGLSKNDVVEVKAGDMVYDSSARAVKLEKGVKVFDADGNEVEYDGASPLKMKQLTRPTSSRTSPGAMAPKAPQRI